MGRKKTNLNTHEIVWGGQTTKLNTHQVKVEYCITKYHHPIHMCICDKFCICAYAEKKVHMRICRKKSAYAKKKVNC
jgi:hypothetical protein